MQSNPKQEQSTQLNGEIEYLRSLKRRAIKLRKKFDTRIQEINAQIAHTIYLKGKD